MISCTATTGAGNALFAMVIWRQAHRYLNPAEQFRAIQGRRLQNSLALPHPRPEKHC